MGTCLGYIFKTVHRSPLKSVLLMATALCFLFALGWLNRSIADSNERIDNLYRDITVYGEISRDMASNISHGIVPKSIVDHILRSGFVKESYLVAPYSPDSVFPADEIQEGAYQGMRVQILGISKIGSGIIEIQQYQSNYNVENTGIITYEDGWDENMFNRDLDNETPMIVPLSLMDNFKLSFGDDIVILDRSGTRIEGTIRGVSNHEVLYVPILVVERVLRAETRYSIVEFEIKSEKNRELAIFKNEARRMVQRSWGESLEIYFFDEELREAAEPLERTANLLSVLYPVTMAVSVVLAAGLSLIITLQKLKEAAILRVLGNGRVRVCTILSATQLIPCAAGILLAFAGLWILGFYDKAEGVPSLLVCSGLFLGGALAGSLAAALTACMKMPMEMLQVKE